MFDCPLRMSATGFSHFLLCLEWEKLLSSGGESKHSPWQHWIEMEAPVMFLLDFIYSLSRKTDENIDGEVVG